MRGRQWQFETEIITFKRLKKKMDDKEIYKEISNDPQPLIDTIHRAVEKIRKRGDLYADNVKYFMHGFIIYRKSTRSQMKLN